MWTAIRFVVVHYIRVCVRHLIIYCEIMCSLTLNQCKSSDIHMHTDWCDSERYSSNSVSFDFFMSPRNVSTKKLNIFQSFSWHFDFTLVYCEYNNFGRLPQFNCLKKRPSHSSVRLYCIILCKMNTNYQ